MTDRIIFVPREVEPLSIQEYEHRCTEPYQQKKLLKSLIIWTTHACQELEQYGYYRDDDPDYMTACATQKPDDWIYDRYPTEKMIWARAVHYYDEESDSEPPMYIFPGAIPKDAAPTESAACWVLKTAQVLHDVLFSGNSARVANVALEFGLAIASAHAMPFEKLAIIGRKSTNGYKKRDDAVAKGRFQQWIRDNPDKVKHITRINQMLDVPGLIPLIKKTKTSDYDLKIVAAWFSEIYPGQFKRGR